MLTLKQVADRLQLSERTLYRLLQRGELPGRKVDVEFVMDGATKVIVKARVGPATTTR